VSKSNLEEKFLTLWRTVAKQPDPEREYQFAKEDGRRWRFDFAFVKERIGIEVEGGTWNGGRHSTGAGQSKDAEKYNAATLKAWSVLRFTTDMLRREPVQCIEQVMDLLRMKG